MAQEEREVVLRSISLSFKLSARGMERLEIIKKRVDADSITKVFREALRIYDVLTEELDRGTTILFKHKDGTIELTKLI